MSGALDPTGRRKDALDGFLETKLREGFKIETHTGAHAIVVRPPSFLGRLRGRGSGARFVISVDDVGVVTMIPAEPKRS